MTQADSVHSTPPINTSANNVKSQQKALARQAAQRQRALKRIRKLRAKAADEIDRLLEFIDAVDDTDVDSQCDDDPLDDDDAEDSLGFLEHHPTLWNGDGRDRSGNQERLCTGLGDDCEDEHDGREPVGDDEPSIGYDVDPPEQDTGNDEPSLGWTEASAQGLGDAGPPVELEESPPVITETARARFKQFDRYAVNNDGRHVESEHGFGPRRLRNLSDRQRAILRPKVDRYAVIV